MDEIKNCSNCIHLYIRQPQFDQPYLECNCEKGVFNSYCPDESLDEPIECNLFERKNMNKELKIKVEMNTSVEINAYPNLKDWHDATTESRDYYVKEQVREYLLTNMEDIIDDIINTIKLEF